MPSILFKSPSFASTGIVLTAEDVQEQGNGLVNASLNYVIDPGQEHRFVFALDSAPPIYPRGLNRSRLQNQALFMVDRSVSHENGLLHVKANYAGALNVPSRSEFYTEEYETHTIGARVVGGTNAAISNTVLGTMTTLIQVADTYVFSYRKKITSYETATLKGAPVARRAPWGDFRNSGLITSATWVRQRLAAVSVRTFYPPSDPLDFLWRAVDGGAIDARIVAEETTNFITPTVKIYRATFIPELISRTTEDGFTLVRI